jgi:hypothetical protein
LLSLLLHALTMAAGGASAQPAAGDACAELDVPTESEPSLLLNALAGDPLHTILQLIGDANLPCVRLVCRAFRDHSSPAQKKCRVDFFRTRALTVFAWDRMPGFVANLPYMLHLAASVGCEDILEELVDNRQCALTARACAAAAGKGHIGALAWLRSRGCEWDSDTCERAAYGGHLEVLRFAHDNGCPWDCGTCYCAAAGGRLEVLRYAHEHGCPWDSATCYGAALWGHLEMLRYAHEHGCPWKIRTCYGATLGGHLEVLRYAHEHGCPLHPVCLLEAVARGHAEAAEYLRAAGAAM